MSSQYPAGPEADRALESGVREMLELLLDAVELANASYEHQQAAREIGTRLMTRNGVSLQDLAAMTGLAIDDVETFLERSPLTIARRMRLGEDSVDVLIEGVGKRRRWQSLGRPTSPFDRLHLDSVILRTLLTRAPLGFAVLDTDLRYVLVNDALAQINGRPVDEHIGRTMTDVVPDVAAEATEAFEGVLGTGEPLINLRLTGRVASDPDAVRTWLESVYRITDNRGILGLAVFVIEVSETAPETSARTTAHPLSARGTAGWGGPRTG